MLHISYFIFSCKTAREFQQKAISCFAQLCCSFEAYCYTKRCEIGQKFSYWKQILFWYLYLGSPTFEICSEVRTFYQLHVAFELLHVCSLSVSCDRLQNNTALLIAIAARPDTSCDRTSSIFWPMSHLASVNEYT